MTNDPFYLVTHFMHKHHGKKLDAKNSDVWGSVLLIDPFPDGREEPLPPGNRLSIRELLAPITSSIRGQAMIKDQALQDRRYSTEKYLLYSTRKIKDGER